MAQWDPKSMKLISFLTLLLAASCAHSQNACSICDQADPGIAGEIMLERTQNTLSGCRTSDFDVERTIRRADQASEDGRFDEAFSAYLAVCDESHPDACSRALDLLNQDALSQSFPSEQKSRFKDVIQKTAVQGRAEETCTLVSSHMEATESR